MPPKRPSPLEDPPSASSSEEEEEEQEEVEDQKVEEDEEEDDDEESEEDEEDEQAKSTAQTSIYKKPSSVKKPHTKPLAPSTPTAGSVLDAQSSGEEDDEGSGEEDDEGSDSEPSPEKPARPSRTVDPNIKPISSKPMDDAPKSKKVSAAPSESALLAKSAATVKRPAEVDKDVSKDSKKMKKMAVDDEDDTEKTPGDDKKKQLFQRLWTEDDELAILKGMLDYHSKKGTGPSTDMNAFLDFIKKSLHVDVSRNQLSDKVRRLKKKYMNNAGKGNEVFSKPHEHKAYELSKKIWGSDAQNDAVSDQTVSNGKVGKSRSKSKSIVGSPPTKSVQLMAVDSKVEVKSEDEIDWSMYPHLADSFQTQKESWIMNMPRMGDSFVDEGVALVGSSKLNELEQKWKKLRMEEVDLWLKRMELMREQVILLQDTYNSRK